MDPGTVARRHSVDAVSDVLAALAALGVVPVVVIDDVGHAEPLGAALVAGGLPCAEVTFRTSAATAAIARLVERFPTMLVGAGTVLSVDQAEAAVAAGSRFVVSPGFDDAVVDWCLRRGVPVVPGVTTATEVIRASNRKLGLVKFFPAELAGGPAALQALHSVFPTMKFMATGGIDAANVAGYLRLPMVAACGGSWLAPRALMAAGDFAAIERLAAEAVSIARDART